MSRDLEHCKLLAQFQAEAPLKLSSKKKSSINSPIFLLHPSFITQAVSLDIPRVMSVVGMENTATHSLPDGLDEDQYIQQLLNEAQARLQSSSSDKSLTLNTESGLSAQDVPMYVCFLCLRSF